MKPSQIVNKIKSKYKKDITFARSEGFVAILCPIYEEMDACYIEAQYDEFMIDDFLLENDWSSAVLIDLSKDKALLVTLSQEAA